MSSLLIDIGGSFLKTCVVDDKGHSKESLRVVSMPKLLHRTSLHAEMSVSELKTLVRDAIKYQLSANPDIREIYVSGQMGCWTVDGLDSLQGTLVSWQDQRMFTKYKSLEEIIEANNLNSLVDNNGNEVGIGVPVFGLISMAEEISLNLKSMRFFSLISWCVREITGETAIPMHCSDAASSGLMNIETYQWQHFEHEAIFSKIYFPKISQDIEPVGTLKDTNILVYCGVGDQQASLLGVGLDDETVVVNVGTGGQVAILTEDLRQGKNKVRPFFKGKTITTRTHLLSGRYIDKCLDVFNSTYNQSLNHSQLNQIVLSESCYDILWPTNRVLDIEFLQFVARELSSDQFLEVALATMVDQYVNVILELDGLSDRRLVFAGGVGQKFSAFSNELVRRLGIHNFVVSKEIETTLAGLETIARWKQGS